MKRLTAFAWFGTGLGLGVLSAFLLSVKRGGETREQLATLARKGASLSRNPSKRVTQQTGGAADKGSDQMGRYREYGKDNRSEASSASEPYDW